MEHTSSQFPLPSSVSHVVKHRTSHSLHDTKTVTESETHILCKSNVHVHVTCTCTCTCFDFLSRSRFRSASRLSPASHCRIRVPASGFSRYMHATHPSKAVKPRQLLTPSFELS